MDLEGLIEDCRREVEDGGFTVAALVGDEMGCDWAYTIGLHGSYGHPELLIVGLDALLAGAVLEVVGERVGAGDRLDVGLGGSAELVVDGGLEFRVHRVDPLFGALGDWFNLGRAVVASWGEEWPASLQLVWSEAQGWSSSSAGPLHGSLRQPLLFGA